MMLVHGWALGWAWLLVLIWLSSQAHPVAASEAVLASKAVSDTGATLDKAITLGESHIIGSPSRGQYEVNVYLPRGYHDAKQRAYPVLYLLDGGLDQDFVHIAGLADLASINPYTFQELIVIGLKTDNRLHQLTAINTDPRYDKPSGQLGGSDEFRTAIQHVVIPYVESTFRVNETRIVMGESLAGLFIVETLLKTPALFTDYVSISPSLWYDDRRLSKQASALLKQHDDHARRFYVAMANEGGTMQTGLGELLAAIEQAGLKNLRVKYQDQRGSHTHWNIYHGAALSAFSWLVPAPPPSFINEPDPWYLIEGANPPDRQTD